MFYGVSEEAQKEIDQLISKRMEILHLNAKRSFHLRSIKELKELANSSKEIDEEKKKLSKVEHEISLVTSTKTIIEFDRESQNRFNQILKESKEKRFALLNTPSSIIDDAKNMANDALIFLYAEASQHIPGEIKESEFVEIERTLSPRSELNYLTWNFAKSLKESFEKPLFKLSKEGAADFIIYNAIPKHFEALRKLDSDANLHDIINECLEQSEYILSKKNRLRMPALHSKTSQSTYQKREIALDLDEEVALANHLIEHGINHLNAIELKLLRIAIMQCRIGDTELYEYQITPIELARFLNISVKNLYKELDDMTDHIMNEFIKIKDPITGKFRKQQWVSYCSYEDGIITIKLEDNLKPYVLGLKSNFSLMPIKDYIAYKSKHTIIIMELLIARMKQLRPTPNNPINLAISLDDLKSVTNTKETYKSVARFKSKVLDIAIQEINEYHEFYHISIKPYKEGRSIAGFWFYIECKTIQLQQQLETE